MQILIMYYFRPIHQPISTHLSISIDVTALLCIRTCNSIHNRSEILKADTVQNGDLNAPL